MHIQVKLILVTIFAIVSIIYLLEIKNILSDIYNFFTDKKNFAPLTIKKITLHVLSLAGILCVLYGFYIEPYSIQVTKVKIISPDVVSNLRIVHLSDFHCDLVIRNEGRVVDITNDLNPDYIIFTGDGVNYPEAEEIFQQTLSNLKAKYGKYAISGNYDYGFWEKGDYKEKAGFELIQNKIVGIKKSDIKINIAGSDFYQEKGFVKQIDSLNEDDFNIYLFHMPDHAEEKYIEKFDLYLAGHTHGGQVCLPFFGAIVTLSKFWKKYESGLYDLGKSFLYVSRGIGMEGGNAPRVRFFCPPEIVVIDIVPGAKRKAEIED